MLFFFSSKVKMRVKAGGSPWGNTCLQGRASGVARPCSALQKQWQHRPQHPHLDGTHGQHHPNSSHGSCSGLSPSVALQMPSGHVQLVQQEQNTRQTAQLARSHSSTGNICFELCSALPHQQFSKPPAWSWTRAWGVGRTPQSPLLPVGHEPVLTGHPGGSWGGGTPMGAHLELTTWLPGPPCPQGWL